MVASMPAEVVIDLVGQTPVWKGDGLWLTVRDVGIYVNADGANGQTKGTAARARELGLYVPPGAGLVPLAAYHPDDWGRRDRWLPAGRAARGLDCPENGGETPGRAWGWLTQEGWPVLQGEHDPAPGYYVSTTKLQDPAYRESDPRRYFDSAGAPGWTLPGRDLEKHGVGIGDLAWVELGGVGIWCQGFDRGNSGHLLELSVDACYRLGVRDCARSGGVRGGASITILPGSAHLLGGRPSSPEAIRAAGERAVLLYGFKKGPP
jgi:hypothetical protein